MNMKLTAILMVPLLLIVLSVVIEGCQDLANAKKCQKWLAKGKCSKNWAIKKCQKTCGKCPSDDGNGVCEDKVKAEKCQNLKNKGKCSKKWVAKICPKTCSLCNSGKCQDHIISNGTFWTDSMNFSCLLYEGAGWCTPDGKKGPGWDNFWGSFQGFSANGRTAKQACCGCGGGNMDPQMFQNDLPIYNGVPSYPYDQIDYRFVLPSDKNCNRCHKCKGGNLWNDNWGYSCKAYHYGDFCTKEGKVGPGWNSSYYGTIDSYHNACRDAISACGTCGFSMK